MAIGKEGRPIPYKFNPYDIIFNHFGRKRYRLLDRTILKPKDILESAGYDLYKDAYFAVVAIATNEELIRGATESLAQWLLYKRGDNLDTTHTEQDRIILAMCAGIDIGFLDELSIAEPTADESEKEITMREITKLQAFRNDLLEQFPH